MPHHLTLLEIKILAVVDAMERTGSAERAARELNIGKATIYRILARRKVQGDTYGREMDGGTTGKLQKNNRRKKIKKQVGVFEKNGAL